jgi:hypothetical protein
MCSGSRHTNGQIVSDGFSEHRVYETTKHIINKRLTFWGGCEKTDDRLKEDSTKIENYRLTLVGKFETD